MTDGTSAALPATDEGLRAAPATWLRAAVAAAVAAAALASVFDLAVAERVVDSGVAAEEVSGHAASGVPEPFTRREQKGGLVLAELVYALGAGLVLAGTATLLGPVTSAARRWLWLSVAGAWCLVVVPAIVLPALPPGVEAELSIDERRGAYAATLVLGAAGVGAAARAWRYLAGTRRSLRLAVASACLLVPAVVAVAALPGSDLRAPAAEGLLKDFRIVSLVGQAVLWGALALVGAVLLRHRAESR